ncbi:hypothetical protein K2P56_02080 [Patescibacteria group bacterium]|nr:hypothetical protein [Patescibacteria group bacterium]
MQAILNTLKSTHSKLISIGVSVLVFAFALWLPNLRLLLSVWTDTAVSLGDKIILPTNLLLSITTNFTPLSALYTIAIAILVGINVALIIELIRARQMFAGSATISASGIVAGALGIGCAACGSLILTALAGTVFGTSALALFPLGGEEFGILGVLLLGYSTYLLSKQISKTVCEITI